jgi:hypothetical protein
MLAPKPYLTKTGRTFSDDDIESLADEVAGDLNVDTLKPRRQHEDRDDRLRVRRSV